MYRSILYIIAKLLTRVVQVAYLMADISDVNASVIKDLHQQLESLGCMFLAIKTSPKLS